jgi:hypothetical protein
MHHRRVCFLLGLLLAFYSVPYILLPAFYLMCGCALRPCAGDSPPPAVARQLGWVLANAVLRATGAPPALQAVYARR